MKNVAFIISKSVIGLKSSLDIAEEIIHELSKEMQLRKIYRET